MGAQWQFKIVAAKDERELREKFDAIQEADRYERGHSYSGGFGMANGLELCKETLIPCPDETMVQAAETFLVNRCEKWECALAIQVEPGKYAIGAECAS